jgi:putative glutamine transport system permease protein
MILGIFEPVVEYGADFTVAFRNTVLLFVTAMAAALVIGTLVAAVRVWGGSVLSALATGYVEFFRNTPLLVQLFFYAVLLAPANLNVTSDAIVAGAIGLGIYTGAYVSEVVRSGILSVDPRQLESARSLALTQKQALRYVVMPQAIRTVIPPLGNIAIALIKNTAIVSAIAGLELVKVAGFIETRTASFDGYIAALLAFWSMTLPLAFLVSRVERRLAFAR